MADANSHKKPESFPAPVNHGARFDGSEQSFDAFTSLVCSVLQVPICAVTLNDNSPQWLEWSNSLGKGRNSAARVSDLDRSDPQGASPLKNENGDSGFVGHPSTVCHAAVPLMGSDAVQLGMLCVIDRKPLSFDAEKQAILSNFASLIAEQIDLRGQAQRDFLTGVLTRRAFSSACASAVRQYRRDGRSSALLLFDLDNFKLVNDAHGHVTGDQVLKAVADVCTASLRPGDLLGRLGGEEFGILLSATEFSAAKVCVERLRNLIEQLALPCGGVTASFGLAMVQDHCEFDKWFAAADSLLYKAKRGGRNCWEAERGGDNSDLASSAIARPRSFMSALKKGLRTPRTALIRDELVGLRSLS